MTKQLNQGEATGKETQKKEKSDSAIGGAESASDQNPEGIRALQTVLSTGERVTILVVGNSPGRYGPLFEQLVREIKNHNHPLWLIRGKGIYSRQEIIKFLRESSKVIAVELSNGSEGKPLAPSTGSAKISFPDVLHWSSLLGLPPEVVLKSGKQTEFSLEKLLEEIGLEKV